MTMNLFHFYVDFFLTPERLLQYLIIYMSNTVGVSLETRTAYLL